MDNIIKVTRDIKDLTGQGTEYLVDAENNVIGKFYDGNLISKPTTGNREVTLTDDDRETMNDFVRFLDK